MKIYRVTLFVVAGLLFLTTLNALSLPDGVHLGLQIAAPLLALYAAFLYRTSYRVASLALLVAVFAFNPFVVSEFDHRTWILITLVLAAAFIRIGLNVQKTRLEHSV